MSRDRKHILFCCCFPSACSNVILLLVQEISTRIAFGANASLRPMHIYPAKLLLSIITPGRRQSKTLIISTNLDQKSLETEHSIAMLSPDWRQMVIENTVSSDFWSVFVDGLEHFRLPPTRCDYGTSLHLHQHFVSASREGAGESVHMHLSSRRVNISCSFIDRY